MKIGAMEIVLGTWALFTLLLIYRAVKAWRGSRSIRQPYFRRDRYRSAIVRSGVAIASAYCLYEAVFWFYYA